MTMKTPHFIFLRTKIKFRYIFRDEKLTFFLTRINDIRSFKLIEYIDTIQIQNR